MKKRKIISKRKKWLKRFFGILITTTSLGILFNFITISCTKNQIFNKIAEIPYQKTGILLGTCKYNAFGGINLYYLYRIRAAEQLFKAKKISQIIISGDNSRENYNEPLTMKNDLISRGIPGNIIHLDYAGFNTLASIIRLKKIFEISEGIIISQSFHNQRALFMANWKGLDLIAFNAKSPNGIYHNRIILREFLARYKMFFDLLTNRQPKYLGSTIKI